MIEGLRPYLAMKDSGVPWLGEVPAHWEIVPNRAVFREVKERDHPDADMLSVTITKGVIRQRALLEESSKKDSSNLDKSAYKFVRPGDIAYNKMRAWQGAVGASEHEGIVSPAYVVQRPRDGMSSRYLHYLLRTPAFAREAERWSYGITSDMWSLRPEHFKMIYSCVPPISEQAAIVCFLDYAGRRIRRAISVKRKLLTLLKEQEQAIIAGAVTSGLDPNVRLQHSGVKWLGDLPAHWEAVRLRRVAELRVSNVDKHVRSDEQSVRLCNYVDVYRNDRVRSDMAFMAGSATPDEIRRFRLQPGDVLITKDSETWHDIGVPALVESSSDDLISGYHLALLRPFPDRVYGSYLFRTLQTPSVAGQFHVSANGVTRYGLAHSAIKSAWLPLPPLAEQYEISEWIEGEVNRLRELRQRNEREIALLDELHTRLIADVVTGKHDVRQAAARLSDKADEAEPLYEPQELSDANEVTVDDLAAALEEVED